MAKTLNLSIILIALSLLAFSAYAQDTALFSNEIKELEQTSVMEDFPIVELRSLDKITARTQTFQANVGSTVKFGPLFIKAQACRKAPPVEQPESAAFLQVWEMTNEGRAEWVFSGWMFASSPGLSHMDHPIYDVWVLDCLETKEMPEEADPESREGEGELAPEEAPAEPDMSGNIETPANTKPLSQAPKQAADQEIKVESLDQE